MGKAQPREIAVFIASPGDLAGERKVFKETIDSLNSGFADGAGVKFIPLGWEDVLAETGRRTQGVINQDVDRCDFFILALHRRWGQRASDSKYSSYTEEEYERALRRWKKTNSPEVVAFFKNVDAASLADPGRELKKVLAFRKKLENGKTTLFRSFNTETDFAQEIDKHLRAFARGEWKNLDQEKREVDLPKGEVSALTKANREGARRVKRAEMRLSSTKGRSKRNDKRALGAKADLTLVRAYQEELTLARAAVEAADAGRLQDATILFAKATEGTTDLSILALASEFFRQIGDVENASRLVRRQAAIAHDRTIAARHYMALLPEGWTASMQNQIVTHLLTTVPEEDADEFSSIFEEIWGGGRAESFMLELMVKHFSTEELTQFARFLGTAEGQSSLQKQQLVMQDVINFSASEVDRVWKKRHPTKRALDATTEPKQLSGEDTDKEK